MKADHQLLLASAAKLTALGKEVDDARATLKRLVDANVSYDSPEMLAAYEHFKLLDVPWKDIERQHLELRAELLGSSKQ